MKRAGRRSYDEDEFNDDELTEELEDEEEFEDDYDSDEDEEEEEEEDEEEEDRPARRTSRKKTATSKKHAVEPVANKEVRLKAFWAVYSQSYQRVETFEYGEKEKAEARAAELTESKKMLHFVKLDKKVIES